MYLIRISGNLPAEITQIGNTGQNLKEQLLPLLTDPSMFKDYLKCLGSPVRVSELVQGLGTF